MKTIQLPSLILTMLFLYACGIDRGGSPQAITFGGAVVAGKIDSVDTASNTIVINGKELSILSTNVLINGAAVNSTQITVDAFAVATSSASGQPGQPERLEIDYNVAGGVTAQGGSPENIIQLGQSINLDTLNTTVPIADLTLPGSSNYAFSGYVTASGEIDATATIAYPSDGPVLLAGIARSVDTSQFTFTIGNQVIDYSQALVITTQTGLITENSRLRVELASNTTDATINALGITEIPLIDNTLGENALISVSGYYAAAQSATNFFLSNLTVITDSNTVFENTQLIALNVDFLLLVEGVLTAEGAVLAQSVRHIN